MRGRAELDSTAIDSFREDGVVLLRGAVDHVWLARLAAAIERDMASPGPCYHGYQVEEGRGRFHGNMRLWETDPDFAAFCHHSPLPGLGAQLLGAPELRLYYDQLFVKERGAAAPTRWHNDQPYWPMRGAAVLSFWLALDPVTPASGGLRFVRGSHRWDRWFQPEPFAPGGSTYAANPDYVVMPDIEATTRAEDIVAWEMAPGDVVAFHALTVHGALANRGEDRRRAYAVRYCASTCTYYDGPGTSPLLSDPGLRGGDPLRGDRYPIVWPRAQQARGAPGPAC